MPTECSVKPMGFARVDGRAVVADFDGGAITSNAGGLLLGAADRAIGLIERFAACFIDGRAAGRVVQEVATLVGQRVFGIALGYEDLIDHDRLRHDPVLGVVLGRLEARHGRCAPLAGKSTLNQLEHGATGADRYRRIAHDGAAIEALFVDLFLDAHDRPPKEIVLDFDATDDPLHGLAADRGDGRDLRQARDDVRASDVAGVDDVLDTGERLQRLGAQQAVGVGDDADQHGRIEHRIAPRRERFAEVPYLVRSVATARRRRNSATGSGSAGRQPTGGGTARSASSSGDSTAGRYTIGGGLRLSSRRPNKH